MTTSTTAPEPQTAAHPSTTKRKVGRVLTVLAVLFLLFDGAARAVLFQPYVDGTLRAGYPAGYSTGIGILLIVCTVLYAVPRTCILGAVLLTAYLGAATSVNLRTEDPLLFPAVFGVWVWAGVFLREPRLWALLPLRRP
jgi:hypothetical protein